MAKLTEEIKESLAATRYSWLATSAKDGTPNVVIVGAFKLIDDETMLISDQFFLKTLANIMENPKVSVSWWGEKGGFQVKGNATYHNNDSVFAEDVDWIKAKAPKLTPKGAVLIKITDAFILKAGPDAGKSCITKA